MLHSPGEIHYTFSAKKGFKTIVQFVKYLTTPVADDQEIFCEENYVNTDRLLKTFQIAQIVIQVKHPVFGA